MNIFLMASKVIKKQCDFVHFLLLFKLPFDFACAIATLSVQVKGHSHGLVRVIIIVMDFGLLLLKLWRQH